MRLRRMYSSSEILHPRTYGAQYADALLSRMLEEVSESDVLDFIVSYIPSDMMIDALEDIADRLLIDISDVE